MNLCHKFNSLGPGLMILGLRVASPKSQGPSPGCQSPMSQGPSSRALDVRVPSPKGPGSGSQVLILDYAVFFLLMASYLHKKFQMK